MELGKHVKGEKSGKCSDRISSLPDELLGHILSCLPTTSAVSTCILSKRWRWLFTLTNCLSFDDAPCYDVPIPTPLSFDDYYEYDGVLCYDAPFIKDTKQARVIRFKKFVNNVLELHQVSPIEKFSIVCRYAYESELNAWFSMAVRKGVQDLYCKVGKRRDGQRLREFTCQTLVRLKMIGHDNDLGISLSARLPSLKVLHLEAVAFFNNDDFSVERFFSGCKVLEELTLKNCVSVTYCRVLVSSGLLKILTMESCSISEGSFQIDAPNLAHLSYKDCSGVKIIPSWKDSCSLAKAELSFFSEAELEFYSDEFKYDRVLIEAAADKVTELHLISNILELLGHNEMPVFRSLSRFQLCDCPFNAWISVTSLLENSPILETVTFHRCYSESDDGDPTVTPPNEDLAPFSCHAKVIEVHHFYGCEYSLLYLGHLLRNARVLERLILHRDNISNKTQIENAMDMLQLLPRASKDCSILLA